MTSKEHNTNLRTSTNIYAESPSEKEVRGSTYVPINDAPRVSQTSHYVRRKTKSQVSVAAKPSKKQRAYEESPKHLDHLEVKILGLWLSEGDPHFHAVRVTFCDNLLISAIVKPSGLEDVHLTPDKSAVLAKGTFAYDPADYEKLCLFADAPLVVNIQPLKNLNESTFANTWLLNSDDEGTRTTEHSKKSESLKKDTPRSAKSAKSGKSAKSAKSLMSSKSGKHTKESAYAHPHPPTGVLKPSHNIEAIKDISSCNIDILPLFLDQDKLCVRKRLQPMRARSCLQRQSWDTLPLLTMSIRSLRDPENARHHHLLQQANWMKLTLVGAYNLLAPYNLDCYYTAATKIPMYNDAESEMTMYVEGVSTPRHFNSTRLYPRWETLRLQGEPFTKGDDKLQCDMKGIRNPDNIDLQYYLHEAPVCYNAVWGSFHRSLVLGAAQQRLWERLRDWKWPLEVHFYGDMVGGFSFMGYMDLFDLLYPGVTRLVLAVPLRWFNAQCMMDECNCGVLLMPNDNLVTSPVSAKFRQRQPLNKAAKQRLPENHDDDETCLYEHAACCCVGSPYSASTSTQFTGSAQATGADDNPAFVLIEVQFGNPLVPEQLPQHIPRSDLMKMVDKMDPKRGKRACRGRGQLTSNWAATVRSAKHALRRVPHHGEYHPLLCLMDICLFNRQMSDSRTRIELLTSFWLDASLYVNNNFVVTQYLQSEDTYQELLLMAHVCLMQSTVETLSGKDDWQKVNPALRAARHARQVNDISHAVELYMQVVIQSPTDGDSWRELSTCLMDFDKGWAAACLSKSIMLNVRHPLTQLSLACTVFESNVDDAEPLFTSLLNMYPLWPTAYIVAYAYCHAKEYYRLADAIMHALDSLRQERLVHEPNLPRSWERELGDYWEPTQLLPGMSQFYDVADLLLRIRAIRMAEAVLGLALIERGVTAAYYFLVAVAARLQGDFENALCLLQKGIEHFGQSAEFRALEGECYHQLQDTPRSIEAFRKAKGVASPHIVLLSLPCWEPHQGRTVIVDLLRRHPSAYAWMALAHDWLARAETAEEDEQPSGDAQRSDYAPAAVCAEACAGQALKWDRRAGRAWALLAKLVKPHKRSIFCSNMAINCGYKWVETEDIRNLRQHSQISPCQIMASSLKACRCDMCQVIHF
ncbi:hypothetical protein O0L34_g2211 [Tuta absoluta]|nr:hypothetical protein O0L34_g2211 [Tuta absoluta]